MRHCGTHGTIFRLRGHSLLQYLSCSTLHIVCFHPETPLGLEIWRKTSLNTQNGTSGCSQTQHLGSCTALGLRCVYTAHHKLQSWQDLGHACSGESLQGAQYLFLFWKGHVCELPSQCPTMMSAPYLFLLKKYKPDEQLHTNVVWAQMKWKLAPHTIYLPVC